MALDHAHLRALEHLAQANSTVLGLSFNSGDVARDATLYSVVNVAVSSVIPLPLAGPLIAISVLVFGWAGYALNLLTSTVGAYITLLLARSYCRPCFLRLLGQRAAKWRALDAAIVADGPMLALLIRCSPLFPLVVTNALLSLTSVSHFTYVWTTLVSLVPANLPYAYAAQVGLDLAQEFPPKDPLVLAFSLFGLLASIAIALKVGSIASRALRRHGVDEFEAALQLPLLPGIHGPEDHGEGEGPRPRDLLLPAHRGPAGGLVGLCRRLTSRPQAVPV